MMRTITHFNSDDELQYYSILVFQTASRYYKVDEEQLYSYLTVFH